VICDANRMMSCSSGIKNTIREQFHAVIHEEPSQSITRRFRSLDSSVPMMQPAKIRMRNNVPNRSIGVCRARPCRAKHAFAPHYNK